MNSHGQLFMFTYYHMKIPISLRMFDWTNAGEVISIFDLTYIIKTFVVHAIGPASFIWQLLNNNNYEDLHNILTVSVNQYEGVIVNLFYLLCQR